MKQSNQRRAFWMVLVLAAWATQGAMAQLGGALTVENTTALTDVIGRVLPGSIGEPATATHAEIRETTDAGGIAPPDPDTGEGDEGLNPLVRNTYLGAGIILVENPGRFSETFSERLDESKQYYARVYDRPSAGASLYYLDSAPFEDDGSSQYANPSFASSTWKLIGTGAADVDSDGDGIPDMWEMDNGLNPGEKDTDGDGFDDLFEVLNDTHWNASEPDPMLALTIEAPAFVSDPGGLDGPHTVSWPTKAGVTYRLEYHPTQVDATNGWVEIWNDVAGSDEQTEDIDWVLENGGSNGFFRVWVWETP